LTCARFVKRRNSVRSLSVITTSVLGRPIFAMAHQITLWRFVLENSIPLD
jgi:hypothetical protein